MPWHVRLSVWDEETSRPRTGSRRKACFWLVTLIHSDKQFLWSPAQRNITGSDLVFTGGSCVCMLRHAGFVCFSVYILDLDNQYLTENSMHFDSSGWTSAPFEAWNGIMWCSYGLGWHQSGHLQSKTWGFVVILFDYGKIVTCLNSRIDKKPCIRSLHAKSTDHNSPKP